MVLHGENARQPWASVNGHCQPLAALVHCKAVVKLVQSVLNRIVDLLSITILGYRYQTMRTAPSLLLILSITISGCIDLRPMISPLEPQQLPETFTLYSEESLPDTWWLSFNSDELNGLMEQGLQDNYDLLQTWARLKQARAIAVKAGADRYPHLDGSVGGVHTRLRNSEGDELTSDDLSLGLVARYELDLWGRVKAESQSAALDAEARREDVNSAAFTLSGRISETWIDQLQARQEQQLLKEQLAINNKLLGLIETRFANAQASALDVYQQKQTVTAIGGRLITTMGNLRIAEHQLAVLTGQAAPADLNLQQVEFPQITPTPPTGLPAELLARRPDIRAAGLRLQGAAWEIAAARADRLPRLDLTGSFTYNAAVLETLLDSWVLRLAANLAGPILDGGKRRAEVERTRAVAQENLAAYRQVVLTAIREVEDALTREQQYRDSLDNIAQQIELTRMAYREATYRYLNGLSDFLPVLREQINLVTTQLDYIQTGGDLLTARVSLNKALGGSWPEALPEPADLDLTTTRAAAPQTTGPYNKPD